MLFIQCVALINRSRCLSIPGYYLLPFVPIISHVLQEAIYIAICVDWQDKYLAKMQDQGQALDKNNFYFYFLWLLYSKFILSPLRKVIISVYTTKEKAVGHQFSLDFYRSEVENIT